MILSSHSRKSAHAWSAVSHTAVSPAGELTSAVEVTRITQA
jgi:hypothetical protein